MHDESQAVLQKYLPQIYMVVCVSLDPEFLHQFHCQFHLVRFESCLVRLLFYPRIQFHQVGLEIKNSE